MSISSFAEPVPGGSGWSVDDRFLTGYPATSSGFGHMLERCGSAARFELVHASDSKVMAHKTDKCADHVVLSAHRLGLTLVTAESCTAGALVSALAAAPNAAQTVHGGFVVYTKQNKIAALGVPRDLIVQQTAVSVAIATAMTCGALERSPADIAVAITGVAGPAPDEDGNPVGLVCIAAQRRLDRALVEELKFEGSREEICTAAVEAALRLTLQLMK